MNQLRVELSFTVYLTVSPPAALHCRYTGVEDKKKTIRYDSGAERLFISFCRVDKHKKRIEMDVCYVANCGACKSMGPQDIKQTTSSRKSGKACQEFITVVKWIHVYHMSHFTHYNKRPH